MIVIFTGPTLSAEEAHAHLDALYLPPVAQGDVCRAVAHRPAAIGIIDGYFDQVPSVWHKEVLWALEQGIPVYGSASMGALRAAELCSFGMVGVGKIFRAFRDGVLEDDDEVAVRHGSAPEYRLLSDALVNIRETIEAAQHQGVITSRTGSALVHIAKNLYYAERSYEVILATARHQDLERSELDQFEAWVGTGAIDLKRLDALAMLDTMGAITSTTKNVPTQVTLENTTLWDELRRSAGQLVTQAGVGETLLDQGILDEIRLSASSWRTLRDAALGRALASTEARRRRIELDEEGVYASILRLHRELDLSDGASLVQWLEANHLSEAGFFELMRTEAAICELVETMDADVSGPMVDVARLNGTYPTAARRALHKRDVLATLDAFGASADAYERAMEWFCSRGKLQTAKGEHDARRLGFRGLDEMKRTVLAEYLYAAGDAASAEAASP